MCSLGGSWIYRRKTMRKASGNGSAGAFTSDIPGKRTIVSFPLPVVGNVYIDASTQMCERWWEFWVVMSRDDKRLSLSENSCEWRKEMDRFSLGVAQIS